MMSILCMGFIDDLFGLDIPRSEPTTGYVIRMQSERSVESRLSEYCWPRVADAQPSPAWSEARSMYLRYMDNRERYLQRHGSGQNQVGHSEYFLQFS